MERRTYLAAFGTAGVGALAGCSVPSTTTRMTDPTVKDADTETHLVYRDDDGRVAVTSVQYGPVTDQGLIRMQLSIWHRAKTTVEDLSVTVRTREPAVPAPEVYLAAPSRDFPAVHFSRDENSDGRQFAVPDIEEVGRGTVTIEWFLRSFDDEWPVELAVDVDYDLDGGTFTTYTVDGTVEFELEQNVTFA
ncbi:Uncharacterized protein HSRCO_0416 [Halanaeroarchaeum sp. HSR-CO]|uniref:hypothetical protein n=1 Tax=Halanaeroarchaeum sp. HSR-CO TaxID=2866382 RepID=UPI00217D761D|nr:hypothetical protein [Halanaeroarchaeum sp. HSR-CO]UWG46713.1 Uncharacterized protein HSRCO_0416 [Halanaeroarchaeum sp. HSR-CO]